MGPAGLEHRQGREGAETDWEAVTESEMKDSAALAQRTFQSEIVNTVAAREVEEESECMHGDSSGKESNESIGLANTKTPVKTASAEQLVRGGAEEFLMIPGPRQASSKTPLAPRSPAAPARACTDREDEEEEEEQKGTKKKKKQRTSTPKTPIA